MPRKSWTNMETVTDTSFNAMVDDVPSNFCHVITPRDLDLQGRVGTAKLLIGTLKLVPICGRYLHIRHEDKSTTGVAAQFWYELVHSAGVVDLWTVSGITSTTLAKRRTTIDMEAITFAASTVIDVTGDEATINLYLSGRASVQMIQIYSGDASADADYGGT